MNVVACNLQTTKLPIKPNCQKDECVQVECDVCVYRPNCSAIEPTRGKKKTAAEIILVLLLFLGLNTGRRVVGPGSSNRRRPGPNPSCVQGLDQGHYIGPNQRSTSTTKMRNKFVHPPNSSILSQKKNFYPTWIDSQHISANQIWVGYMSAALLHVSQWRRQ